MVVLKVSWCGIDADRQRAERLQLARHGRGEALFAGELRYHELVARRAHLVRAVRPSELLHSFVRCPGQLYRDVDPPPRIPGDGARVQRHPSAGRIRDDRDQLLPRLELPALLDVQGVALVLARA